eukprot:COSAG06_NODE_38833_length_419_cov_0.968750_1_plen_39_part_01
MRSVSFDHELQLLLSEPIDELISLRSEQPVLSKVFTGLT